MVATIVDGEGDMTRLTVAGEDSTNGSVDGTSPTVTAVARYQHLEPGYAVTVDVDWELRRT
ncbi:hypothetical protein AB0I91_07595 [Actinosynnema sp. NPDC049800]